jgi:hypothetical protein
LGDAGLLYFPALRQIDGFAHAITTRPWNMAPHVGPQAGLALERRRMVCEHLGLPFERLTATEQVHGAHVVRLLPSDAGAGRDGRDTAIRFVDGVVGDIPGVPVMLFSADCPLIVAVDPRRRVFGMAHASWRGTVDGMAGELIRQLRREFEVNPADLVAGICPCAGVERYEVGDEVMRVAQARWGDADRFFPLLGGRRRFDLRAANLAQLVEAGVPPERITVAAECTIGDGRFFSHRRDGPDTGRFALVAGFRE